MDLFEPVAEPIDEEDPFGPDTIPSGYARQSEICDEDTGQAVRTIRLLSKGLVGVDPERSVLAQVKKYNPRLHYPRTIKALLELHPGGKFWPCDSWQATASGALIAKDMLGFADVWGLVRPYGSSVAAQVTTIGSIGAHLRKYTDPNNTVGQAKVPIEQHLREFLALRGRLYIFGFYLPPNQRTWEHEIVVVTTQLLDEYKSRKRRK